MPIRDVLWADYPDQLYPAAFWVGIGGPGAPTPISRDQVHIHPESGLFSFKVTPPTGEILTQFTFALSSTTGAGGFDSALLEPMTFPAAVTSVGGGGSFASALSSLTADATVEIKDSRTYLGPTAPLTLPDKTIVLTALAGERPVVRWHGGGASWTITGTGGDLVVQGVWLQGADIVLAGKFETVSLRFVTLDPGSSDPKGPLIGTAIDNTPLAPVHLWIEASVETLTLDHCITGPIRTRNGGAVEQMTATDSVIQAIATTAGGDLALQSTVGTISLARCTVLGKSAVHRLEPSECILDDVAIAEDMQHGCVRFSAYAARQRAASAIPLASPCRRRGPIFVSRRFGEPNYARLRRLADAAIIDPQPGDTVLAGAQNESEMGAFSSEGVSLKKRGLVIEVRGIRAARRLPGVDRCGLT